MHCQFSITELRIPARLQTKCGLSCVGLSVQNHLQLNRLKKSGWKSTREQYAVRILQGCISNSKHELYTGQASYFGLAPLAEMFDTPVNSAFQDQNVCRCSSRILLTGSQTKNPQFSARGRSSPALLPSNARISPIFVQNCTILERESRASVPPASASAMDRQPGGGSISLAQYPTDNSVSAGITSEADIELNLQANLAHFLPV